jgi:hypothetical protein
VKKDIWLATILAKSTRLGLTNYTHGREKPLSIVAQQPLLNYTSSARMLHTKAKNIDG